MRTDHSYAHRGPDSNGTQQGVPGEVALGWQPQLQTRPQSDLPIMKYATGHRAGSGAEVEWIAGPAALKMQETLATSLKDFDHVS